MRCYPARPCLVIMLQSIPVPATFIAVTALAALLQDSSISRASHCFACLPAGNNGAAPSPSGAAANTAATGADPSQPTTHIQVRMSDGSKLKGTFNLRQTVGDIRKWVG